MVKVNNLVKSYGSKMAVAGISLEINRGDIFCIIGPNGAGKSTTIETILGTKKPDSGDISILGLDPIKNRKEIFSRVGVQFQESAYQGSIKVKEILEFTSSVYNLPYNDECLKEFNLFDKRESLVSDLSGGERQKLTILLASIHIPELLFLDELTTGLDPAARRETWKYIKKLNSQGTTIVLTSHFMDEVEHLCNRGLFLINGRIVKEGSVNEIIEFGRGKNLDQAYMNILEGVLQ